MRPADALRWRAVREQELREIDRERSLRHLLLELGSRCARSGSPEELVRDVLRRLVSGLDLAAGWVALPTRGAEDRIYSTFGAVSDSAELRDLAAGWAASTAAFHPTRVPAAESARLPDEEARGEGVLVGFRVAGPDCGWLLLVAGRDETIPDDVDDLLTAAAGLLGGSVARIGALSTLRRLNRQLEVEVARRTADLVREKESLEIRVRERTAELETAKRAVLDSERRLLDLERHENVRQLAAGVAHELNNPLGAATATVDFLREEIAELATGQPLPAEALVDLREAVTDLRSDMERMRDLVAGLFGDSASQRLAAVRTSLDEAVAHALRHFRRGTPPGVLVEERLHSGAQVGIPAGELTRWVFRLLSAVVGHQGGAVCVETRQDEDVRSVRFVVPGLELTGAESTLAPLADEIETAGCRVTVGGDERAVRICVELPPACGDGPGTEPTEPRS